MMLLTRSVLMMKFALTRIRCIEFPPTRNISPEFGPGRATRKLVISPIERQQRESDSDNISRASTDDWQSELPAEPTRTAELREKHRKTRLSINCPITLPKGSLQGF